MIGRKSIIGSLLWFFSIYPAGVTETISVNVLDVGVQQNDLKMLKFSGKFSANLSTQKISGN
jgi:hypothetical protein